MIRHKIKLIVFAIGGCLLTACGMSSSKKCETALTEGNLKEAELHLKGIKDSEVRNHYGGMLIEEYLDIENIDRAIFVFDRITGHCSMYDMQYTSLYSSYTKDYSKKIYNALIKSGRYDEAWNYHPLSYENENYPGNAPNYFSYMADCIVHMCNTGNSAQVSQFIKQKAIWFLKNVDNSKYGKDYPDYQYDIMRSELNKVFNEAQN